MADTNVTYHPYTHEYDIRAIKDELLYEFWEDGSEIKMNMDTMVINPLMEFNTVQHTLADSVKLPYTGTTTAERQKWLQDRIEAVYDRLDMIRSDIEGNKQQIINAGGTPPVDLLATIGAVLSIIPVTKVVGTVTTVVAKLVNRSNDNAGYKQEKIRQANEIISGYASDVPQLSAIQKKLVAELSAATNTNALDYNAATPWPTSYYVAIAVIVMMILLYIRKRNLEL